MRGRLLPVVLLVVACACGSAALWLELRAPTAGGPVPVSAAPVLSARRVPVLLSARIADDRLKGTLDRLTSDGQLGRAREASCLLVHAPDGRVLYDLRSALPLIPASNIKLVTAAAALDRLGAGTRYVTEVRASTPPQGGVVAGDLWMVGAGDPLLATADFAATAGYLGGPKVATPLEALADRLVAAGVRQVQGRVLGDESRYDTQRYVPSWNPRYVTDNEIGPMSALTVNGNFTQWRPRHVAAPAPAANAAAVLASLLSARGVTVGGTGEGTAPAGARALAALESPTLAEVVGVMLRESDNLAAELLVKELGARFGGRGSTAAGTAVVRADASARGLPLAGLTVSDGSGLDRSDRATCALLTTLLTQGRADGPLGRSLPVAGRDGTLTRRFLGTPAAGRIRAKTGSLDHVVGLSGWADSSRGGPPLAFSLLANELPRDSVGTGFQDKVVSALVQYPQAPPPEQLAPAGGSPPRPPAPPR